jgi:hypothetical protein
MANPVVGLDVELKVDRALAELKRLSPGADKEAKAIAASLGKELRAAEKAAKSLGDTSNGAASKALRAFGPLGGVLSRLDPQVGAVASSIAGVTSAVEGFEAAALGPAVLAIAAAAVVATAAWHAYSADAAEAARIGAEVTAAHKDMEPVLASTRQAEIDLALATGQITAEAAKLEREGIASMNAFATATAKARDRIAELHGGEGSLSRLAGDLAEAAQGSTVLQITSLGLVDALAAETTSSREAQGEIDTLMGTIAETAEVTKAGTAAHRAASAAAAAHGKAAASAAVDILAEAKAAQAAADAFQAKLDKLEKEAADADAIVAASGEFRLTEIQKLQVAEDKAAADYLAKWGSTAEGVATIRANYEEQITAAMTAEEEKRDKAAEEARAADLQAAREHRDAWLGAVGATAQAVEQLGQAFGRTYDTSTAAGMRAARRQWQIQHGISMAVVAAQGIVAVAQAAGSAPPPANVPAIVEAGITAGARFAAVSAIQPSFHAGGLAPDEAFARVQPGERVVSKQGVSTLDEAGARANAGMGPASTRIAIELKLRHSSLDTAMAEVVQRGGRFAGELASSRSVPYGARGDTWRR